MKKLHFGNLSENVRVSTRTGKPGIMNGKAFSSKVGNFRQMLFIIFNDI